MLKIRMAPWWPIRCSVIQTTCSSSSEKVTRLTAVGNSHTKRHLPVCTDQSRISLSAEPDMRNRDCATGASAKARWEKEEVVPREREKHAQSTSIVQTVPLCPS